MKIFRKLSSARAFDLSRGWKAQWSIRRCDLQQPYTQVDRVPDVAEHITMKIFNPRQNVQVDFLSREDLDTGTIVEPSIAKLVVSERSSSKFSGRSYVSSMNLSERILETNLGGIRARPGPKLKAFSGARLGLGIMLGAVVAEGMSLVGWNTLSDG